MGFVATAAPGESETLVVRLGTAEEVELSDRLRLLGAHHGIDGVGMDHVDDALGLALLVQGAAQAGYDGGQGAISPGAMRKPPPIPKNPAASPARNPTGASFSTIAG